MAGTLGLIKPQPYLLLLQQMARWQKAAGQGHPQVLLLLVVHLQAVLVTVFFLGGQVLLQPQVANMAVLGAGRLGKILLLAVQVQHQILFLAALAVAVAGWVEMPQPPPRQVMGAQAVTRIRALLAVRAVFLGAIREPLGLTVAAAAAVEVLRPALLVLVAQVERVRKTQSPQAVHRVPVAVAAVVAVHLVPLL